MGQYIYNTWSSTILQNKLKKKKKTHTHTHFFINTKYNIIFLFSNQISWDSNMWSKLEFKNLEEDFNLKGKQNRPI